MTPQEHYTRGEHYLERATPPVEDYIEAERLLQLAHAHFMAALTGATALHDELPDRFAWLKVAGTRERRAAP